MLTGDVNNYGYHRVALYKHKKAKKYFRHRLVAEHFIDNPNLLKFVNHIDGNKSNNTVSNLEWCNQSHNEKHAFATGLKQKTNKKIIVEFMDGHVSEYSNQHVLANELCLCQQTISMWLTGKRNAYKQYKINKIYFI